MSRLKKYNNYEILEDQTTVKIEINSPKYGIFYCYCDIEDWMNIKQHNWCLSKRNRGTNYISSAYVKEGKRTKIEMHRFIMNTPKGMFTNHINHNGLNNCRSNLEICTKQENTRYQLLQKVNTSGAIKYFGKFAVLNVIP